MKASETTLQSVIEGSKQYIVPLYQRSYSWDKKQWQTLWDDLVELCESDGPRTHFLGSLVTMQTTSVPEGVPKFFLIDGQQRLTTIFILLTLLRDQARSVDDEEMADEIEKLLLVNSYKKGNEYFKILPTQGDRPAFQGLVRSSVVDPGSRVCSAYRFFEGKLRGGGPGVPALKKVLTENLSIVSIVLDRDDNPYLVFESLNAKGEPLTQADLIRNFFFLKVHADRQDEMHATYWRPMQDSLGDRLTEFIRHYLMKDGAFIRADSVYFTLKDRLGSGDVIALLRDLSRSARLYERLLDPAKEPDSALREALDRLDRLEVTTAYPFLLHCYDEHEAGTLSADRFREIVACLENFIVRRFVCGVPTNQLNKLFPPLFKQIRDGGHLDLLEGVRRVLPLKGYPKDAEFTTRLMDAKLYGGGDRRTRTRLILETIERSFGHKEPVALDSLNIEHVMPQTLTDSWRLHLGETWEETHSLLLDTLGNLTLTGYNPELSNADFAVKKGLFGQKSHIQMNQYFESIDEWRGEDIESRAEALSQLALGSWPYFGLDQAETEPISVAKGKPQVLRFLGGTYPVHSWRDVLQATLEAIGERDADVLPELAEAMPALLSREADRFHSARPIAGGLFVNVNLSTKGVNGFCRRILDAARIAPESWAVETE